MIVKIFPESDPNRLIYLGTECDLKHWFSTVSLETDLGESRMIIESVSEYDVEKELRKMREFNTGAIRSEGNVPGHLR